MVVGQDVMIPERLGGLRVVADHRRISTDLCLRKYDPDLHALVFAPAPPSPAGRRSRAIPDRSPSESGERKADHKGGRTTPLTTWIASRREGRAWPRLITLLRTRCTSPGTS